MMNLPHRRPFDRRELLRRSAIATGWAVAPAWLPAAPLLPQGRGRVVVLQLRGGNDGLNTVIPVEDDLYYRARPTLAIAATDALPLDDLNRFHPALTQLARRYADGDVTLVQGVGYPSPNLSHFRGQDIWDTADTSETLPSTGWIGRFVGADGAPGETLPMIAMGREVIPLAMRTDSGLACAVPSLDSYTIPPAPQNSDAMEESAREQALLAMTRSSTVRRPGEPLGVVNNATDTAWRSVAELAKAKPRPDEPVYPDSHLGRDLRGVARIIASGASTRFFYVTQDGYDTHTQQAVAHAALLSDLDASVDAFLNDLTDQKELDDTLVVTISEFGRRVAENGIGRSAGTDHGAGSTMMLLGGKTVGGIVGAQPDLEHLDPNGNLVHAIDFREVYAGIVKGFFHADPTLALHSPFRPLQVIRA